MVREKMKTKRTRFSSDKAESRQVEDFIQCLEDEGNNSEEGFMDLYEEQSKEHTSEVVESLHSMIDDEDISDISGQADEIKDHNHGSQTSVDPDEEMAQCVPELVISSPQCVQTTGTSKIKESQRPKFKVTPKRKEMSKSLKKKALNLSKPTENGIKKPKKSKTCDYDESSTKTKNKEGSWVQCSRNDCLKWRKLPNDVEPTAMPDRWVCAMNPDPSRMDCTASQETCDSQRDYDVVYTQFVEGSLVWAKVPGYPWWPGMVEDDPDYNCCYETDESDVNPINYHVSFIFDKDVSRSWVSYLSIRNFSGTENPNETHSKPKKQSKSLLNAITKARSAMALPIKERLKTFSFQLLYKGPIARATAEEDYQMDFTSDSQPSIPPQGSISFTDKKKLPKDKVKKTKKSKRRKENEKIAKHVSKMDEGRVEEVNTSESLCENGESEDVENKVKSKKKRKRVIVSSEDEDDELKKESNSETATNLSATNTTIAERRDDELLKEKLETEQSGKKGNSSKEKAKCVEAKTTEPGEDVQQMDVEGAVQHDTSDKNDTKLVKINGDKKKIEGKQTKKLKKLKESQENGGNAGTAGEGKGDASPQKKKRKQKKTNEEKNGPEKASSDDLKNIQMENKKPKKVKTGISEKSKVIKKKKMVDGGVKSTDSSISDEVHKSSSEQGDVTSTPEEKNISEDLVDKSVSKDVSVDEEEVKMKQAASPAKETNERDINNKKKEKKIKKSDCVIPANKKNKTKCKKGNNTISPKATEPLPTPRLTNVENSGVISEKEIKSAPKPTHKKTKTTFGKFKAPVKSNQNMMAAKASQPSNSKLVNKKTNKEKSLKKHGSEMEPTLGNPPGDLDCYVSIETLEKDITNFYQQLSQSETTAGFLPCATQRNGSDCVTVEFLDQELTLNTERNPAPSTRSVTDSPEY